MHIQELIFAKETAMTFKELSQIRDKVDCVFVDNSATGLKILELCQRNGIKSTDLAEILGFTGPQAVYNWSEGKSKPTLDNLLKISHVFGTDVNDIIQVSYKNQNRNIV